MCKPRVYADTHARVLQHMQNAFCLLIFAAKCHTFPWGPATPHPQAATQVFTRDLYWELECAFGCV